MTLYPASHSEGAGRCGGDPFITSGRPVDVLGLAKSAKGLEFQGVVDSNVAAVKLDYNADGETGSAEAVTEQVPPTLLGQVGEPDPLGVFIAYLPPGADDQNVTATAYDSDGSELGTGTWAPLPD